MLHHYDWIVTSRCTQIFFPIVEYSLTLVDIKEIKECPHHLEVQVINFSNYYNQDDHKNSVVNSQDLIEQIQLNNMTY